MIEEDKAVITRIIACGVFKPALDSLQLERRYPQLRITYLESNLHLKPFELKDRLVREIDFAQKLNEKIICLYGDCFRDIDGFCKEKSITKITGSYCHEMLLGPGQFTGLMNETSGTYFIEKEVLTNFDEHCRIPLELDDKKMRGYCFEHYQKLLYVRQSGDPDLIPRAKEIAEFLDLSLDIRDADYSNLEKSIINLL